MNTHTHTHLEARGNIGYCLKYKRGAQLGSYLGSSLKLHTTGCGGTPVT